MYLVEFLHFECQRFGWAKFTIYNIYICFFFPPVLLLLIHCSGSCSFGQDSDLGFEEPPAGGSWAFCLLKLRVSLHFFCFFFLKKEEEKIRMFYMMGCWDWIVLQVWSSHWSRSQAASTIIWRFEPQVLKSFWFGLTTDQLFFLIAFAAAAAVICLLLWSIGVLCDELSSSWARHHRTPLENLWVIQKSDPSTQKSDLPRKKTLKTLDFGTSQVSLCVSLVINQISAACLWVVLQLTLKLTKNKKLQFPQFGDHTFSNQFEQLLLCVEKWRRDEMGAV